MAVTGADCAVAVMVTTPAFWPVAKPLVFRVATVLSDEAHVSSGLMVSVLPSEKVPVAVNWTPEPGATVAVAGAMASDVRTAELTVIEALPVAVAPAKVKVALMVVVPALTPTERPGLVVVFDTTVAIEVLAELQRTEVVRSSCELSLNTPVAVKRVSPPVGMVTELGAITILEIVAFVTVNCADVLLAPSEAVTVIVPGVLAEIVPLLAPIVAVVVSDEAQLTWCVMSLVLPSLKVPIAVACAVVPCGTLPFCGK